MGDKLICITKNRKAMKIIILHDADARIEYLDVADHLLGSDIEEFLTRQGFSVNNITWPVSYTHLQSKEERLLEPLLWFYTSVSDVS